MQTNHENIQQQAMALRERLETKEKYEIAILALKECNSKLINRDFWGAQEVVNKSLNKIFGREYEELD